MRYLLCFLIVSVLSSAVRADWLTAPSFYTHDAQTGRRTHQHSQPEPKVKPPESMVRSSGMHHYRSSLQYGPSADHYHRVEEWGSPIQPYGEWRFPYRPYSVPYDAWGAPWAGFNLGFPAFRNRPVPYGGGRGPRPRNTPQPPAGIGPGGGGFGGPPRFAPGQPNVPPRRLPPGSVQPWQPQTPYPGNPWAEGEYFDDSRSPRMNDQQFFYRPRR